MGGIRQGLGRAAAVATAAILIGSGVASADNLVADGDGVTPIANNALLFGNVCANPTVTKPALLGTQATGHPGAGTNVFANSALVTVTVGSIAGSGLTATVPASPGNRIT